MRLAIAAAGPMSPASSRFTIATEASTVFGEYRNTTADTVVHCARDWVRLVIDGYMVTLAILAEIQATMCARS